MLLLLISEQLELIVAVIFVGIGGIQVNRGVVIC